MKSSLTAHFLSVPCTFLLLTTRVSRSSLAVLSPPSPFPQILCLTFFTDLASYHCYWSCILFFCADLIFFTDLISYLFHWSCVLLSNSYGSFITYFLIHFLPSKSSSFSFNTFPLAAHFLHITHFPHSSLTFLLLASFTQYSFRSPSAFVALHTPITHPSHTHHTHTPYTASCTKKCYR